MGNRDERSDREQMGTLLVAGVSRRDLMRVAAAMAGLSGVAVVTPTPSAASGTAVGQAAAVPARQPSPGGQMIWGRAGDPDTLDPHRTNAAVASAVFTNIFDPLVGRTMDLQFEGLVAERWEISPDGLQYTFFLRPGLKFHDGTDVNAEAVKFTFDRLIDPATEAESVSWIGPLDRTEVIDPLTVRMVLREPFSPFLGNMSIAGYFGILSPTAVQQLGDEFGQRPVGSGPFRFKERITGESVTLERNPDYQNFRSYVTNKGAPYLDELVFRNIPEEQTMVAAFETGEINLLVVPPRQVPDFEANADYQVLRFEGGTNIQFLEFSMLEHEGEFGAVFKPPFDDVRLRQAVAHAINADEIIERVLEGLAIRNYGPMPVSNNGYNPEIETFGYHYDVDAANRLLDEAGWVRASDDGPRERDGQPLRVAFWTWVSGVQERVAQVIQNQLTQVGFQVDLTTMEVATLLNRLGEPDDTSNMDLMGWGWGESDLLYMMTDSGSGVGRYQPESYRRLVTQARQVTDLQERANLYFEAMKVMLADAAMVPLWTTQLVTGVRTDLQDFKLGPQGTYVYVDAHVAE